ncbi:major facilitator superfamily domain-containing protein 3-like [Diadema antillarum]|uniref:major facilitator superfamily domain-containing protein 3-like n=1 Tax=Diadema antillarum TaxID=105358 RepID=UPI003A8B0724
MIMMINISKELYWLMLLYGIQGVPYGFQVAFLPILLHAGGTSLTEVSLLRFLNLPWMLKLLWVPLVTSSGSVQRPLTYTLGGLALVFALTSVISIQSIGLLSVAMLTVNILVSLQDISVDTFAIRSLSPGQLAAGNAIQVVGYKLGAMLGGGALTLASELFPWSALLLFIATLYSVCTLSVHFFLPQTFADEHKSSHNSQEGPQNYSAIVQCDSTSVLKRQRSSTKQDGNEGSACEQCRSPDQPCNENAVFPRHRYNLRKSTIIKTNKGKGAEHQIETKDTSSLCLSQKTSKEQTNCNSRNGRNEFSPVCAKSKETLLPCAQNINGDHNDYSECLSTCQTHLFKAERKLSTIQNFAAIFSVPDTGWLILYLLTYKLGEQGGTSLFPLYLLDTGVSARQVALWTGMLSQWISIAGSLMGARLVSWMDAKRTLPQCLAVLCVLRVIAIFLLSAVVECNNNDMRLRLIYMCVPMYLLLLLGGAVTTATFTMMMLYSQRAENPTTQALHHTTMATAEVVGKVVFTSLAGLAVDHLGYALVFRSFTLVSLLPLFLLSKINSK